MINLVEEYHNFEIMFKLFYLYMINVIVGYLHLVKITLSLLSCFAQYLYYTAGFGELKK
jgi:hypothetical protein